MSERFNERLKRIRKEKGRTQSDVADFLNIKRQTVTAYEKGDITPQFDKIKMLAEYFNVSVDYLMGKDIHQSKDTIDLSQTLSKLIDELNNSNQSVAIDGVVLDDESKALLIASLEQSIKTLKFLSRKE